LELHDMILFLQDTFNFCKLLCCYNSTNKYCTNTNAWMASVFI
jgi:hypothetical protein